VNEAFSKSELNDSFKSFIINNEESKKKFKEEKK